MVEFCVCLFGFVFFTNVISEDCSSSGAEDNLFVNIGDNIEFRIKADEDEGFYYTDIFEFYHGRDRVCHIEYHFHLVEIINCLPVIENRTSVVIVNPDRHHMIFDIIIANAEISDNGTYEVHAMLSRYSKCFSVYILGKPESEITVTPTALDVGSTGIVKCSSRSTTIPETHNLIIKISWFIGDDLINTGGRFLVDNDELIIYVVIEADINLVITCEAREERGLMTRTNTSLPIYWGPDPVPELQPSNTFYHTEPGIRLPNIHCSVYCHPACELRWHKHGSPAVLSFNGTLSLEVLDKNSTGEYICAAINLKTTKNSSISFYILIQEDKEHTHSNTWTPAASFEFKQNYTPLGAVGGALGAALVLALICIIFLLRRGITSKLCNHVPSSNHRDDPVEIPVTNLRYEDLPDKERTSQQYEALNTDVVRAVIKGSESKKTTKDLTRRQKDGQSEMMVYENTCIDQRD